MTHTDQVRDTLATRTSGYPLIGHPQQGQLDEAHAAAQARRFDDTPSAQAVARQIDQLQRINDFRVVIGRMAAWAESRAGVLGMDVAADRLLDAFEALDDAGDAEDRAGAAA